MLSLRDTINELMNVPEEECDLEWLKNALQTAIKLEFSTLPPYLCALWSIKDVGGDVYNSIRQAISQEEMVHFAIACNLLTSIGGTPKLNTPADLPIYPGPLPGLDNPDLILALRGLTPAALQVFLQVEYPEFTPIISVGQKSNSTIGKFYSRILNEFQVLATSSGLTFQKDRQIDVTKAFFLISPFDKSYVVENLEDIDLAIRTIQRQGEGSNSSPADTSLEDLAHYYRFAEIVEGQRLIRVGEQFEFSGKPVPFPPVFPMAKVPFGGYQKDQVPPEVATLLDKFDEGFTQMMNELQLAWTPSPSTGTMTNENYGALERSIDRMRSLGDSARKLMDIPILADMSTGNFGPCFRLVSAS